MPPPILYSLFGVESITDENVAAQLSLLPEGDSLCTATNMLVTELQNRYGCYLQPRVVVRGSSLASKVMEMMTEDALRTDSSFSDYLMQLHSNIIASI